MATDDAPSRPTRTFRIAGDLAEKLYEVLEVEGVTSADFFDPLVRTEIENRHKANAPAITAMRRARSRARKLREQTAELGGEG